MKYLDFNKTYPVEDVNGGWIIQDNGVAVSVPFEVFFKSIILVDDRWGKSIKLLNSLMDLREKVKELSFNDNKPNKILEMTDEEWSVCLDVCEQPNAGYNINYASAILKHVNDLKSASSIRPDLST